MKSIIKLQGAILVTLFFAFFISGCEKIKEAAEFDILYNLPDYEIAVDSTTFEFVGGQEVLLQREVYINLDSIVEEHNVEKIKEVKFDMVKLTVVSPAGVNLNWIKTLRLAVSAPGLAETDVASKPAGSSNESAIELDLGDVSITQFIEKKNFTLKIYVEVTPPLPADEINLLLESKLRITVQPF